MFKLQIQMAISVKLQFSFNTYEPFTSQVGMKIYPKGDFRKKRFEIDI